jgi:hypothetical protein
MLLLFTVLSYCWISIAADTSLLEESVLVPHNHSSSSSININNSDDSRRLTDFEWDIVRKAGYPKFSFNNATEDEVTFKYSVSGTETATYGDIKYFQAAVYTEDCTTTANLPAILLAESLTDTDEYTIELDILQEFISDSDYYQENTPTNATINFCIRLDYIYAPGGGADPSIINFHETNVTLAVDLTAGFSLTGIAVDRDNTEQASAAISLEYPVKAYFCDDNSVQLPAPTLSQGAVMQFCVEISENVTTTGVYVSDVLSVDLDQISAGEFSSQHADIITGTASDWLTRKICTDGICNIKTQLTSKWFAANDPESMDIVGAALLAFGTAARRRYLRVTFSVPGNDYDYQQQRKLQDLTDAETFTDPLEDLLSEFGLTVDFEGDSREDDNRLGVIIVCVAGSVGAILLCNIVSCCCCRKKVITKTTTTNIYDSNNAGVQSIPAFVGISPAFVQSAPAFHPSPRPPPPLPITSSGQQSPPAAFVQSAPAFYSKPQPQPPPPLPITSSRQQSPPTHYSDPSLRQALNAHGGNRSVAPDTQSVASFHDDSDNYDVRLYPEFTAATMVTPVSDEDEVIVLDATDGRLPLHMQAGNSAFATSTQSVTSFHDDNDNYDVTDYSIAPSVTPTDDEVIIVSAPIVTKKKHKSKNSSRKSCSDGLHRESRKSSSRSSSSDGLRRESRKSSSRNSGSVGLHRESRKSSSRHSDSDGLHRSDIQPQNID